MSSRLFQRASNRIRFLLPSGGSLPQDVWQKRYSFLLGLTWVHAATISLAGPALGYKWEVSIDAFLRDGTVLHTLLEGAVVGMFALLASVRWGGRSLKSSAVAMGLMTSSAVLVHMSGGYIELHFHFFVMLVFLALLQDWVPYILAICYVGLHHGIMGWLAPEEVYNHAAAIAAPWTWAGIHAFFVLCSALGSIVAWRFNEKMLEKIRMQAKELEEASRLQADFTAMIAHDLRSPLSTVSNALALLEDGVFGDVTEEQKKWLGKTQNNCRVVLDIVNDFLDVSKIEAGKIDLIKERIDLYKLVQGSLDNYGPMAASKNISLTSRVGSTIAEINADGRRLEQVLSNLITNAIKFTGPGGSVEVGACPADSSVKLWVKDTGIGIPVHETVNLFQKYHQTTSGRTCKNQGTGLGLVICKMIAEAHGGRISVESDVGKGSTFAIELPLQ